VNAAQALRWRQYMLQQFGERWCSGAHAAPEGCGRISSAKSDDALQFSWSVKEL
jgi:hypothetical protein